MQIDVLYPMDKWSKPISNQKTRY